MSLDHATSVVAAAFRSDPWPRGGLANTSLEAWHDSQQAQPLVFMVGTGIAPDRTLNVDTGLSASFVEGEPSLRLDRGSSGRVNARFYRSNSWPISHLPRSRTAR